MNRSSQQPQRSQSAQVSRSITPSSAIDRSSDHGWNSEDRGEPDGRGSRRRSVHVNDVNRKAVDTFSSSTAVCIWIPNFPLRAEERRRPELARKPSAIVSATDMRRIWQVSPIARKQGVVPGMTVSQSIGLCATLTILEPDPVYYDEQFSALLLGLTRVSPVIEPVELGRVYVGVDGMGRLVGGPEHQIDAIVMALAGRDGCEQGHLRTKISTSSGAPPRRWKRNLRLRHSNTQAATCTSRSRSHSNQRPSQRSGWDSLRIGWGRGKFTAWVAACRAKPGRPLIIHDDERDHFLASQSVAVLPIEQNTHRRLWQLGIKTLGGLANLPVDAVVSQFGNEGRIAWQLATGMITEPVIGKPPPEHITTQIEFPLPVADRAILSYAIQKLVDRALRDSRRIGWRVYSLRVRAQLEYSSSWVAEVTLKDPSANSQHICTAVNIKLEQNPPTGAVESLTIEFTALVRGTSDLQLFARDATSAARAGRQRALRWASKEIQKRLRRSMLHHVIEVHPWSRLPERRYALIDYDP